MTEEQELKHKHRRDSLYWTLVVMMVYLNITLVLELKFEGLI